MMGVCTKHCADQTFSENRQRSFTSIQKKQINNSKFILNVANSKRWGEKPQLKIITIVKGMAETKLKAAKIEPGSTKMANKQMPGTVGNSLGKLITNCYQVEMKEKMTVYHFYIDVEAIINAPNARTVLLTPTVIRSDYRLVERRYICNGVFKAFKQRMGGDGNFFYYDLNHLAYSLKDPKLPKTGIIETFTKEEVLRFFPDIEAQFINYTLKMKPIEGVITLADYSHLTNDMAHIDHTLEQFLNIATSQEIFDNPVLYTNYSASLYYLLHPAEYGFLEEDCPELPGNSSFLGIGGRKGVRPIELTNGQITSGLVVELKKSPFHVDLEETVLEKLQKSVTVERFNHMTTEDISKQCEGLVKGVWVRTLHRPGKFEIHGISKQTALTQFIPDTQESVYAYFVKKYGFHIENPNVPLLTHKQRDGRIVGIPMELCQVLDDQRVKGKQQAQNQIQHMIRQCAIPPSKMIKHNSNVVKPLNLAETEYLTQAMIEANSEPIKVDARVIPAPDVHFAHQNIRKPTPSGTWTGGAQYLIPASSTKWAAVLFYYEHDNRYDMSLDDWKTFLSKYRHLMTSHGMNFSEPTVERHAIPVQTDQHDRACKLVQSTIEKLYQLGHEFALMAHPDAADHVHHAMKFYEQKTEIVTQGLKIGTVINVLKGHHELTLANIIQKTNVKMGGLNYDIISGILPETPSLFSKDTLVIGFSMNHPGSDISPSELSDELAKEMNGIKRINTNGHNGQGNGGNGNGLLTPSVVGFSANVGKKHIFEFIGDFLFQAPLRNEKIEILQHVVKRYLIQFRNVNNTFPIRMVIYRDGVDQGAFENILKYEVPLLKNMMAEMGCHAKVILMVVNKKQPLRLYRPNPDPRAKPPEQNIPPGTVVDTGVVHPKWTEFYLNSHQALQGTARTPCYTVLVNEEELGLNALQVMTHHFCFGHQIVYSPTSLPTPVYVALECAKRGRNVFNYYTYVNSNGSAARTAEPIHDYDGLTSKLSYENSKFLRNMRINA